PATCPAPPRTSPAATSPRDAPCSGCSTTTVRRRASAWTRRRCRTATPRWPAITSTRSVASTTPTSPPCPPPATETPSPRAPQTAVPVHHPTTQRPRAEQHISPGREKPMKITSTRRLFLAGTGVVGSAAALAACGGQATQEEQQSKAAEENKKAAEEQGELPSTAWERMEYDQVPDGGTLRKAILTFPANWNRAQVDGNNADTTEIAWPCGFEKQNSAIIISDTGEKTFNPDYVESAEMVSEDPQTIRFKYNPKGKWDNGDPIVVDDLIAEWKATNGSNEEFLVVSTVGSEQIESITQTDDEFSGEIVFSSPYIDWITLVHPGTPAAVYKDPETFNTGYVDEPTPGNGPFSVANLDPGGGVVTLERNQHWWGRAPKLESSIFQVVDQTTQPQSFANGEIDWLDVGTGDVLSPAKTREDAVIQTTNG